MILPKLRQNQTIRGLNGFEARTIFCHYGDCFQIKNSSNFKGLAWCVVLLRVCHILHGFLTNSWVFVNFLANGRGQLGGFFPTLVLGESYSLIKQGVRNHEI